MTGDAGEIPEKAWRRAREIVNQLPIETVAKLAQFRQELETDRRMKRELA